MNPTVLLAGETLVEFPPGSDAPLAAVERFERRAGGAPPNVAVRLAQLGRPPWFWTRVGADPFGDFLAGTLADRGVPERFVERDAEAKTTLACRAYLRASGVGQPAASAHSGEVQSGRLAPPSSERKG